MVRANIITFSTLLMLLNMTVATTFFLRNGKQLVTRGNLIKTELPGLKGAKEGSKPCIKSQFNTPNQLKKAQPIQDVSYAKSNAGKFSSGTDYSDIKKYTEECLKNKNGSQNIPDAYNSNPKKDLFVGQSISQKIKENAESFLPNNPSMLKLKLSELDLESLVNTPQTKSDLSALDMASADFNPFNDYGNFN